jgi:GT2 family glycosyltransferase
MSNATPLSVVIATRNRREQLALALDRLTALAEQPPIVVVDNASQDGSPAAVRARHPQVQVIELRENRGAGARTVGARAVDTPLVAFSDDDSWWAPGALARAVELFDRFPRLALVAARTLVGDSQELDPVSASMAAAPLGQAADLPGPSVLGFLACSAVVRRRAFLDAGGFERRFGIGSEEGLLAMDLAAAGWGLAYVADIVGHHHPLPGRDPDVRRRRVLRNELWTSWLRRPAATAANRTWAALREAATDPLALAALADAFGGLPWALRNRRRLPFHVERAVRCLEARGGDPAEGRLAGS